jgi:dTDP-4-amino-4,6-dideoxygalactose transaminase
MQKTYPLFKTPISSHPGTLALIDNVLQSGYVNEGVQVAELTQHLETILESKNISLLNSCTSAITVALRLAGVKQDSEVISTAMTCVATNTPIIAFGADIVWADIDPTTAMSNVNTIIRRITPKTKAIVIVAWAGNVPPGLDALFEFCETVGIPLILDAAHAFDARCNGRPIHEFAHFTCYSFQAIKHFSTGDGGALICRDSDDHARAKALKWFGLDRDRAKDEKGDWKGQQWDVDVVEAGYKFNMNNVAAAIGLAQVNTIKQTIETFRKNARRYDALFSNQDVIRPLHRNKTLGTLDSPWVYTVTIIGSWPTLLTRDQLLKCLNSEGIMAGLVHVPNDSYTAFSKFQTSSLPGLRTFEGIHFSLPCGSWINDDDVEHIANRVLNLATSG